MISGGEFLVLVVVAALVLGPKNVAQALHGFKKLVASARSWSAKLRAETAVDLGGLGISPHDAEALKNFDLSQYDPRQIVRQAVQEEMAAWMASTTAAQRAVLNADMPQQNSATHPQGDAVADWVPKLSDNSVPPSVSRNLRTEDAGDSAIDTPNEGKA
ncbi:MAG: hypothetical protein LKJ57_05565 [Ancrocorticia sp.]|jgi:sec-independent protein translocase protein TatB|nr:hypothetical protein [Ancrocorticia sp.]MCI2001739.1 hypothetical protein [Ancrocorticia sp.]MCI2013051.1 hypothetical protein [Ancrocorticia sp.]MCI2178569.1 hypothetical protein [Ancrocorticia sp.]MCI2194176.1 hypothetical protein [Ancrocorticia sp.]